MTEPARQIRLLGISGSVGSGARTTALVAALLKAAEGTGSVATETVDLHALQLPFCDGRAPERYPEPASGLFEKLAAAAGFVFGTPVYRASISGVLKNFFDLVPAAAMAGKPACLVVTGGSRDHFLVADYALRPICAALGIQTSAQAIYADHAAMPDAAAAGEVEGLADAAGVLVDLARHSCG
ncbi:MAG TPA: NAD(P)H-dependent oxidoreductase [Solirubrobacterales bacterium]